MEVALAQKLESYHPKSSAMELIKKTPILLLVGPTGAGKDALKTRLLASGGFHHIVSHTTRPPRINHGVVEKDGQAYHFIDEATAAKMLDEQAFIEAKIYSNNLYGTSVAEIQTAHDDGKVATTDLEVQGVAEYKHMDNNVMAVFLLPPNFRVWQKRLQNRYGDVVDVPDMRRRMETALREIQQLLKTNYYMAVVNNDLAKTFVEVQNIIKTKHHQSAAESQARAVARQLVTDIENYLNGPELR